MLGYLSAGAYSNADMAANYLGFLFYRNLTEPVVLKGREMPPMLVKEDGLWKIAPHVRHDNDFAAMFIDDRLNEAFNPSHYEEGMRQKIREAMKERQAALLERFADENGARRPMEWFEEMALQARTYYGTDYGHHGPPEELLPISSVCFDPLPPDASPNDRNDRGYTPLHDAVIRNDEPRLSALLASSADPDVAIRSDEQFSSEWGATPLHLAARDGSVDLVERLLEAGAHVSVADDRGATALHYAAGRPAAVSLLIDHGADPRAADLAGRTPLHWAANLGGGHVESIEALVRGGAEPDAADRAGRTPLHLAAARGDAAATAALIELGAQATQADRLGRTPLHEASRFTDDGAVRALLDGGAEAAAADVFGVTPPHDAAGRGRAASVEALLAHGAPPGAADRGGATPLHLAARGGHDAAVAALVAAGADPNTPRAGGMTPLHEAAFSGRAPVIAALTASGARRAERDALGRTPRAVAKERGHREVLELLAFRRETRGRS
jgi:cytohesin